VILTYNKIQMICIVPDDILRPHLEYCVQVLGFNDAQIEEYMKAYYDENMYTLSYVLVLVIKQFFIKLLVQDERQLADDGHCGTCHHPGGREKPLIPTC
jgi:hypothetical protein